MSVGEGRGLFNPRPTPTDKRKAVNAAHLTHCPEQKQLGLVEVAAAGDDGGTKRKLYEKRNARYLTALRVKEKREKEGH